jgi:hypothetical protein
MSRALEPDECYWIAHEPEVRGRSEIDLDLDPLIRAWVVEHSAKWQKSF